MHHLKLFFLPGLIACLLAACGGYSETTQAENSTTKSELNGHFLLPTEAPFYYSTDDIYAFLTPGTAPERMISAHRGSRYYEGWPENCIESFEYILSELPAVLEMDLRLSKDSVVFLLHDETLDRTTTGSGKAHEKLWDEIRELQLLDDHGDTTHFNPPSLRDVLKWSEDKAIIKLDIKRNVPFELVIDQIRSADAVNRVIVIVYSLNAARVFNKLAPEVMISLPVRNIAEFEALSKSDLPKNRLIAFTGTRKTDPKVYESLKKYGIIAIQGTIGNLDQRAKARGFQTIIEIFDQGAGMIATDYPIELYREMKK